MNTWTNPSTIGRNWDLTRVNSTNTLPITTGGGTTTTGGGTTTTGGGNTQPWTWGSQSLFAPANTYTGTGTATGVAGTNTQGNNRTWSNRNTGGTLNIPTSEEMFSSIWNLPFVQPQLDLINLLGSEQGFQQALQPQIAQIMRSLRGNGMESSSYSDRLIANTLGSQWMQNQFNTLSGIQNMERTLPNWMYSWWQPYNSMLQTMNY